MPDNLSAIIAVHFERKRWFLPRVVILLFPVTPLFYPWQLRQIRLIVCYFC